MSNEEKACVQNPQTTGEKVKAKVREIGNWVNEHKVHIIIGVTATAGTIVLFKNRDDIVTWLESFQSLSIKAKSTEPVIETITKQETPLTRPEILEKRTGNMLTATKLGRKVGLSNREINKRIVKAGLATKEPYQDYVLTEAGELFGTIGSKETPWGKDVPLVQWDESVLDIIVTPEERVTLDERQRYLKEVAQQYSNMQSQSV